MTIEEILKDIKKLEKKKKWQEASKLTIEIANNLIDKKDFENGLKYYEQAITMQQKDKQAEPVIVLYRKIISAARKGKNRTKRELFRYAAAAIPLVEEYIQVLQESNRYETKHGALTRYFLGECRDIVSGVSQRNREYLIAGKLFTKVGLKLANSDKSVRESEESFQKARIIFDLMKNREETFLSFLSEAEISIRKYRLEKGFSLFDAARSIFQDEDHLTAVANIEKVVFAEMGLELLRTNFIDSNQREIAEMLILKSRQAHLEGKSLNEVSAILLDMAKIYAENNQTDSAFKFLEEAISNSQVFGDDTIQKQIIGYLFQEGKLKSEELMRSGSKSQLSDINNLEVMKYFDKIEQISKQLDMGSEAEETAMYIWKLGGEFKEKFGIEDFPYTEKALQFLIRSNRLNGIEEIGDDLEKRLDFFAEKQQTSKIEDLKNFLLRTYSDVSNNTAAGALNLKIAQYYSQWGNHEAQIACLRDAFSLYQGLDQKSINEYAKILTDYRNRLKQVAASDSIQNEILDLLGNTYLLLKEDDQYDSLYAQEALLELEANNITKAMEYHNNDFEFLKRVKNITRALARVEEMITGFFKKGEFEYGINLCERQANLLIETSESQEKVLQIIKSFEEKTVLGLSQKVDENLIDKIFAEISKLYTYLQLQEGLGDSTFEISGELIEKQYYDLGFHYLRKSCEIFRESDVIEKVGMLLDYASEKQIFFQDQAKHEIADRFLDFLINSLLDLSQYKEAAGLMMERAVSLVSLDESKAYEEFIRAKDIITNVESSEEEIVKFYQNYGSALLQIGQIDKGMDILANAEGIGSASSLAIADICLNVAKDRFTEDDFDTYFILVDRALEIYTKLEMYQESSSIALTEARKLWIAKNLSYTMIFLERAWAPLSVSFDETLKKSIKPLLQVAGEIIDDLFKEKRFDEAKNFLEFQERIYKHVNDTEKILEVEKKKIDALIGRGNIEGALAQVLDLASIGIEESKFNETIALIQGLLPIFFSLDPVKSKFLLKLYLNTLITVGSSREEIILETIEYYIQQILKSHKENREKLFEEQTNIFFLALAELAGAETFLGFFTRRIIQEMSKLQKYKKLFSILNHNIQNLISLNSDIRMRVINELTAVLEYQNVSQPEILTGFDILLDLSKGLNNIDYEIVAKLLLKIGTLHKNEQINNKAIEVVLEISETSANVSTALTIYYEVIEENLKAKKYLNALSRLDEVINKLDEVPNPEIIAMKFSELLNKFLLVLAKEKKKEWMDLLTAKYQYMNEKFLGKGKNQLTIADEQLIDDQIDEMLDFANKGNQKSKKK